MAPPATTSDEQRRFGRLVVLFVVLGYLAVLAAAVAAALVVARTQVHSGWVAHTYQVENALGTLGLQGSTMRSEALSAAYLHRPRSALYESSKAEMWRELDHVGTLTADNPGQQARMPLMRAYYGQFAAQLDPPADADFPRRLAALDAIRAKLRPLWLEMGAEEERLLVARRVTQQESARRFWIVLPVAGILLLVVAVASIVAIRRFTGDLARSKDELAVMNEGLEDAVQERTRDLQRANEEIQRFAYIVSHDLRSPLVNVMGFTAELDASRKHLEKLVERAEEVAPDVVTPEARAAAREDLPEAIGFIRSSTQKMDRLINAILRLSREGRRALAPEALDAAAIVGGAIDSMRHRIDELGVDIRVEGALPSITTDRLAFEQIITNLIENAVKYLKPGRAGIIRISGSSRYGRTSFDVIDNGRGIEPRDHERIFDLFRRSGAQDQPGEGIGLAHVRALAHRLGGAVDVKSELDKGATFSVSLPVLYTAEKDKAA